MFSFAIKCDDYFSENNNDNVRDGIKGVTGIKCLSSVILGREWKFLTIKILGNCSRGNEMPRE